MQIEKYIADKITSLCEKRDISKYRLSQLSGISQSSLGRIMAQENLPSLITLEKICVALGVTLSQFFQEGNSENLTEKQKKVVLIYEEDQIADAIRYAENLRKTYKTALYIKPKKLGKFLNKLEEQGFDGFQVFGRDEEVRMFGEQ